MPIARNDRALLKIAAEASGTTVVAFVRTAALKAARRTRKPEPQPEPKTALGPAPIEVEVTPASASTETPSDTVFPPGWASELLTH
ncbi:MAG: hypothetical protein WA742_09055 [Candidatus Cybelea sp.]